MTSSDLTQLSAKELFQKIEEYKDRAQKVGEDWAQAKFDAASKSEMLPSKLSEIQRVHLGSDSSVAESKVFALADKNYQGLILEALEYERQARCLEVEYRANLESLKALTSVGYLRNQELKTLRT